MLEAQQEYYSLPLNYGDTYVTVLPRDPHWIFAFWEISEDKKNGFIKHFGCDIWKKSIPVLKVTNVSKNTSFFIRINDFSDNWYINIPDTNNLYVVEIGRKLSDEYYINLCTSNYILSPSSSISPNTTVRFVNYKDWKEDKLELRQENVNDSKSFINIQNIFTGPSSLENLGIAEKEQIPGISSVEFMAKNITEYLGISSAVFNTDIK